MDIMDEKVSITDTLIQRSRYEIKPDSDSPLAKWIKTERVETPLRLLSEPRWGALPSGQTITVRLEIKDHELPVIVRLRGPQLLGRRGTASKRPNVFLDWYNARAHGVSRIHAALVADNDIPQVMDMNSTNGTFLNGQKLLPYQPRVVRDGDELCLGNLTMLIHFEK